MADVTISSLPLGTPSGNNILPYSTGFNTLGVPVSALFQSVGSNVGIGLMNPNVALTINGQLSATGSLAGNQNIIINNSLYNQASMALVNYLGTQAILATDVNNWNNSLRIADSRDAAYPNTVSLYSNNNIRMFVAANGNVKIGADSNPQAKLDVAGDVKASNTPKAWVSFNGQGAINQNQSIYSQYNISSVVKENGEGRYTINFASALLNANYCITGGAGGTGGSWGSYVIAQWGDSEGGLQTTTSCRIGTCSYGGWRNMSVVNVAIYGT